MVIRKFAIQFITCKTETKNPGMESPEVFIKSIFKKECQCLKYTI